MGRVLPVKKHYKSHIIRKPIKEEKIDWLECPVCGQQRINDLCPTCSAYHAPKECAGEGCKICEEIKFIKEHSKKEFVLNKKNSLLSPPG